MSWELESWRFPMACAGAGSGTRPGSTRRWSGGCTWLASLRSGIHGLADGSAGLTSGCQTSWTRARSRLLHAYLHQRDPEPLQRRERRDHVRVQAPAIFDGRFLGCRGGREWRLDACSPGRKSTSTADQPTHSASAEDAGQLGLRANFCSVLPQTRGRPRRCSQRGSFGRHRPILVVGPNGEPAHTAHSWCARSAPARLWPNRRRSAWVAIRGCS